MHVEHEDHRRRMGGLVGQVEADVDFHDSLLNMGTGIPISRSAIVGSGRSRKSVITHAEIICVGSIAALPQTRSAPSPTRARLARVAVYLAQVGQARLALGEGWGRGVVVVARDVSANCYPHPQPLPTRGGGAHRACGNCISSSPSGHALARAVGLLRLDAKVKDRTCGMRWWWFCALSPRRRSGRFWAL